MQHPSITLPAMKAAAKAMSSIEDPRACSHEAMRAALRVMRKETPPFHPGGMTRISGTTGCGKSEATHAMQRIAAAQGYRTATLCRYHEGFQFRWAEGDVAVAMPGATEIDTLESLTAAFNKRLPHTMILLEEGLKGPPDQYRNAMQAIRIFFEIFEIPDLYMVVREADSLLKFPSGTLGRFARRLNGSGPHPKWLEDMAKDQGGGSDLWLRDLATRLDRNGGHLVIETQGKADNTDLPAEAGDTLMQGKSTDPNCRIAPSEVLKTLESGEFFTRHKDDITFGEAPYEAPSRAPVLGEFEPLRLRFEKAAARHTRETHIQRLEMMARVMGYRSWHAAQGALSKRPSERGEDFQPDHP